MYELVKRLMDIAGSLAGLLITLPVFILLPILIKLDSPGAVFYYQKRQGRGKRPFNMLKFRTMVSDADDIKAQLANSVDGPMFKVKGDPRVTGIGRVLRKYSLDELPQLINILMGDMSLVGPRPLAMAEMMGEGCDEWRERRLSVRPGLTGLWQIMGRETHEFKDWVMYDLRYLENRSLALDVRILLKTAGSVLGRSGDD